MTMYQEQILSRIALEAQVAAIECLCKAVQALSATSLPDEQNPYYVPPATSATNPTPAPEQYPTEWTECRAAYGYLDYLARYCDHFAELASSPIWSGLALLAAIVGGVTVALSGAGTVALALGGASVATALWGVVSAFGETGLTAFFTATANELRTNTRLQMCVTGAFVNDGTAAGMQSHVTTEVADSVTAGLINALITQETIDAHKNGIVENSVLYFPESADTGAGCGCPIDGTGYELTIEGGSANWVSGSEIDGAKVYLMTGSGSDVTKYGSAYAKFTARRMDTNAVAAVQIEVVSVNNIQVDSRAGSNQEYSFYIPYSDSSCSVAWGGTFSPPVGYVSDWVQWVQFRGKANTTWTIGFKIVGVRDRLC